MHVQIPINERKLAAYCRRWRIVEFALFGSVIRDDFGPDSDIDVLITFEQDHRWSLFDLVHMKDELEEMLGRKVDLSTRKSVEQLRNPYRREAILNSVHVIHAA